MLNLIQTKTEFQKLIRKQRQTGSKIKILYISLWDKISKDLMRSISSNLGEGELYVVNTFDTPDVTRNFGITRVPALVTVRGQKKEYRVRVEDYPAMIYKVLKV